MERRQQGLTNYRFSFVFPGTFSFLFLRGLLFFKGWKFRIGRLETAKLCIFFGLRVS